MKLSARWLRFLLGLLLSLPGFSPAQSVKVLIQDSPLAGFQFHAGPELWPQLREGDALTLSREPDNPHDPHAIRITWHGQHLGYLPRAENALLAAEMDKGTQLTARITRLSLHPNPWKRIRVAVYARL